MLHGFYIGDANFYNLSKKRKLIIESVVFHVAWCGTKTPVKEQNSMVKLHTLLPAAVAAAALAVPAWARTVSVSSFDRTTGETVLAISAAEAGDGDKALVAAWSATQMSDDASDVRASAYVGAVSAAETSKSFTVPAAWLAKSGVVRFFLMASLPPYDGRLASIRSASAGPYIDTGFVPTTSSEIRVTARYDGDGSSAPFGVFGACQFFDSNPSYGSDDTAWYYRFLGAGNASSSVSLTISGREKHEYCLNARGAFIDGLCKVAFDPAAVTETTTGTLTLFGRKRDPIDKQGDCTIFSAQLSDNGSLVHDYVPCSHNGVATLYDRATRSFCTVSGSGSFVAGDEIGPAPDDCDGVESATDSLMLAPQIKAAIKDRSAGVVEIKLKDSHDAGVLYWVGGATDAGTSLAGWQTTNFLCKVAADAMATTTNVPPEWLLGGKSARIIWRSAEDVPYDREVEWLHSSGTAHVNTGVRPTMQTEIAVRGKSAYDVCLFGLTKCFYMFCNGAMGAYGFFSKAGTDMGLFNTTEFHTFRLGPTGAYLDGAPKVAFSGTSFVEPNYQMTVFFRKSNDNGTITKNGDCTIKWAKISESGRVVRDLVPCVAGGEACFYDRATGSFLRSAVSGASFEAGETMASLTDADALAWSDVVGNDPMVITIR